MKSTAKKCLPLILALVLSVTVFGVFAGAAGAVSQARTVADDLAAWQLANHPLNAENAEVDGNIDWTAFALFRAGYAGYEKYLAYIDAAVKNEFDELYLTDFARIALAVGAAGGDARDVGGYDLINEIASADFGAEMYTAGLSYSLLALNSLPYGEDAAAQTILSRLLSAQRPDGGFNYLVAADPENPWSLDGDVDTTAMLLQAIAPYVSDDGVSQVYDSALAFVVAGQKDSGGFGGAWGDSPDTTAQALAALSTCGLDPLGASFVKGGNTILDAVKAYQNEDGGIAGWDGASNSMSSYQMLYALAAYIRFAEDRPGIFDFSDVSPEVEEPEETQPVTEEDTDTTKTEQVTEEEIPLTGSRSVVAAGALLAVSLAFVATLKAVKNDD